MFPFIFGIIFRGGGVVVGEKTNFGLRSRIGFGDWKRDFLAPPFVFVVVCESL